MHNKISEAIKMAYHPIAVYRTDIIPDGAIQFKEDVWACVIGMLNACAKNGKIVAFDEKTVTCVGGKAGLGLKPYEAGVIEYFLSVGGKGPMPAEHYKKTPELALAYIQNAPKTSTPHYLVFRPLDEITDEQPEEVIFLVNADQLSGLATLANYDTPSQDNVKTYFGAGCLQSVLYGLEEYENNGKHCFIGLTDPSARKCIDKDLLSFSIPWPRFLEMEENVDECFFGTETWSIIRGRIK